MVKLSGLIKRLFSLLPAALLLALFIAVGDLFVIPLAQGKFSEKVLMPEIRDLDSASARALLKQTGLEVSEVKFAYHESVPFSHVIHQQPAPGTRLKPNRRVKFTLSLGEELIIIPDLKELSPSQASDTLQKLGLRLGEIREIYVGNERTTPGTIISSNPPLGGSLPRGGMVSITISQSSLMGRTFVPDLVHVSLEQARKMLAKQHLKLRQVTAARDPEMLPGTVLKQSVEAGAEVDQGIFIDVVVSE